MLKKFAVIVGFALIALALLHSIMAYSLHGNAVFQKPIADSVFEQFIDQNGDSLVALFDKLGDSSEFVFNFSEQKTSGDPQGLQNIEINQIASILKDLNVENLSKFMTASKKENVRKRFHIISEYSLWYSYPYGASKDLIYFPDMADVTAKEGCDEPEKVFVCSDLSENIPIKIDSEYGETIYRYIGNGWFIVLDFIGTN